MGLHQDGGGAGGRRGGGGRGGAYNMAPGAQPHLRASLPICRGRAQPAPRARPHSRLCPASTTERPLGTRQGGRHTHTHTGPLGGWQALPSPGPQGMAVGTLAQALSSLSVPE